MGCEVCDAPCAEPSSACLICGWRSEGVNWDRRPEAAAYEDLSSSLSEDNPLLAVTRGRISGSWRGKLSLDPRLLFTAYGNLGITSRDLVLQYVNARTGRALARAAATLPLEAIAGIDVEAAHSTSRGQAVRLSIRLDTGESLSMRAYGRLAAAAKDLVEVWEGLTGIFHTQSAEVETLCGHCGRSVERAHHFCPYCGQEKE